MVLRYDDQRADLAGQAATLAGGALDAASCGAPLPGARLPRQLGDFYPTPEWLANALVAALPGSGGGGPCLDPGAGTGALGRAVARRWPSCPIVAVELEGVRLAALPPEWERVAGDFLKWEPGRTFPLVVCNPPFSAWIAWAERCLQLRAAGGLVLVLGFSNILASRRRAAWWRAHPPAQILQVSRRPCYRAEGGNDPRETIGIVWGPHDPGGPPPAFTWLDLEAGR
jgi:phospholipid N-methyltransferase